MKLQELKKELELRLLTLGVRPVTSWAYYCSKWSTEQVSHYVYMKPFSFVRGTPVGYMQIKYGFRNNNTEEFAYSCWRAYGGPNLTLVGPRKPYECSNNAFAMFAEKVNADVTDNSVLRLYDIPEPEIASIVAKTISRDVFPVVAPIVDVASMLEVLISDRPPFQWAHANAALRTPQIAALACMLGRNDTFIEEAIKPFAHRILGQIQSRHPGVTVERYIRETIAAAHRFLLQ